jgi:threonine/homoserine/homoserine lactone efflux protein
MRADLCRQQPHLSLLINEKAMSLITFLIAATVLAVTPGPGVAYVVARTVAGGRTEGLASGVARAARARLMTRLSGVTMIGLSVFLATARRQG